jgi:hypothetical protein
MKYQIRAKNQKISHKRIPKNGTRREFVSNFHEHKQPFGNKKKMTKYLQRCGPESKEKLFTGEENSTKHCHAQVSTLVKNGFRTVKSSLL